MRWKTKLKPRPNINDVRERKRFAWLPVACGDVTVWLEPYISVEQYNLEWSYSNRSTIKAWRQISRKLCE
jgi:hypothetical protein